MYWSYFAISGGSFYVGAAVDFVCGFEKEIVFGIIPNWRKIIAFGMHIPVSDQGCGFRIRWAMVS